MNKRAIENLIKAGAMDGLGGTRKQFMSVYVQIADHIAHDKKNNLAGQISLFDIAGEEDKEEFDIRMPNVGEYSKEMLLGFEKRSWVSMSAVILWRNTRSCGRTASAIPPETLHWMKSPERWNWSRIRRMQSSVD